jgi:hypothetical protein
MIAPPEGFKKFIGSIKKDEGIPEVGAQARP